MRERVRCRQSDVRYLVKRSALLDSPGNYVLVTGFVSESPENQRARVLLPPCVTRYQSTVERVSDVKSGDGVVSAARRRVRVIPPRARLLPFFRARGIICAA